MEHRSCSFVSDVKRLSVLFSGRHENAAPAGNLTTFIRTSVRSPSLTRVNSNACISVRINRLIRDTSRLDIVAYLWLVPADESI